MTVFNLSANATWDDAIFATRAGNDLVGGIYMILNRNGSFYYGSTRNFKARCQAHCSAFQNNRHPNKHMQAAWNRDGAAAFQFLVVEVLPGSIEEIRDVEQAYLDVVVGAGMWRSGCYNVQRTVRPPALCFSRTPNETRKRHSESARNVSYTTRERRSVSLKKCWQDPNYAVTQTARIRAAHLGKKRSQETKNKLAEHGRTRWLDLEYAAKMSRVTSNPSKETRSKMSASATGNTNRRKAVVRSDGVVFPSVEEAAQSVSMSRAAVSLNLIKDRSPMRCGFYFSYLGVEK